MPCYHPNGAWKLLDVLTAKGKPTITLKEPFLRSSATVVPIQIPCGQCIGCRLEKSRQWAIRCVHESKQHEENSFITLTYDNEHLPANGSLDKKHFKDFVKRLRKFLWYYIWVPKCKKYMVRHKVTRFIAPKIRYFHCGEYGENTERPHYHACVFGYSFPEKEFYSKREGVKLYKSDILKKIWGKGFVTIGDVTFESAAYVARYVLKKVTGKHSEDHYKGKQPEYTTMSRRKGIGRSWYETYKTDVFPADEVVLRGKVMKPPKYYDKLLESQNVEEYTTIKDRRKAKAEANAADNTKNKRLLVKEKCKLAQIQNLKRSLHNI